MMKHLLRAITIFFAFTGAAQAQDSCSIALQNYYYIASDHNPGTQAWSVAQGAYVTQASDAGYLTFIASAGCSPAQTFTQAQIFANVNQLACSITGGGANQPGDSLSSDQVLTYPLAQTQIMGFSGTGHKATLPQANLAIGPCIGRIYTFKNIAPTYAFTYEIDAFGGGTILSALPIGMSVGIVLEANDSTAGTWTTIPYYPTSIDNAVIGANAPVAGTFTTGTFTTGTFAGLNVTSPLPGSGAPGLTHCGSLVGANMNSTADQAITITPPAGATTYFLFRVIASNPSTSMTTTVGGVYTAASKGGATLLIPSSQVYSGLTTNAANTTGNVALFNATTTIALTLSTIYLSLTTPQGGAATLDFDFYCIPLR